MSAHDDFCRRLQACTLCKEHSLREILGPCVPPEPPPTNLLLMIVGQSPGYEETVEGRPFVGRSGQLLDELLGAAGIPRQLCYITNTVKCQPFGNRQLHPAEIQHCKPFLREEMIRLDPRAMLLLGKDAWSHFSRRIPWQHGFLLTAMRPRVLVSKHPSYFLRHGDAGRQEFLELGGKLRELVYETV